MASGSGRTPHVAYLVKRVERAIRLRLDGALAPLAVTTPEYTALSILGARDGLSSAELSRRVFVTPQAMNQIVLALEDRGMIRRKVSAHHGRVMTTSLTAKGKATLEACDRAALRIEEQLLESLPKSDAVTLGRVLSACVDALDRRESPLPSATTESGHGVGEAP
jgi:DNA-binding MarR family transcriptional regulator